MRLINRDFVAKQGEVERRGQARGARSHHRNFLARGRHLARRDAVRHFVKAVREEDGVRDQPVHFAHVHRFVHGVAAATIIAGVLADAARGGRQGVIEDDGFKGFVQPPFLVKLEEAGNVHVQRATVLARGKRQVLADAGAAPVRAQMVFKLMAEMPHGGEHRIGRRLPQPAQGGIANHAPQLVQRVQILFRPLPLGELVEDAEGLVQSHAAGYALAAGLGMGELDEVAGDVHHAVVVVHHHHAAGAHDGAEFRQRLVIHRRVEHLLRVCIRPKVRRFAPP